MKQKNVFADKHFPLQGILAVFGCFLAQLIIGTFHGTFGNLLPYFTSYFKKTDVDTSYGDLAMVLSAGGVAQGFGFLLAGTLLIPMVGNRWSMVFGCLLYCAGPATSYFALDNSIAALSICYGAIAMLGFAPIMISSQLVATAWFPKRRGLVQGLIMGGFGLGTTVFAPLQTWLINPDNIEPTLVNSSNLNSTSKYFTSPQVLDRLPISLLYLSAIYFALLVLAIIMATEYKAKNQEKIDLMSRIRGSLTYLGKTGLRSRDFYCLFLTRYFSLIVTGGLLAHWKTFSFQLNPDDRLMSILGASNGGLNFCSRFFGGALMDRLSFSKLMTVCSLVMALALACLVPTAWASFHAYLVVLLILYLVLYVHFATVPLQVIKLFDNRHAGIIIGVLGLSDTAAYGTLAIINYFCFKFADDPFLVFFESMAVFALLAGASAYCVRQTVVAQLIQHAATAGIIAQSAINPTISLADETKSAGVEIDVDKQGNVTVDVKKAVERDAKLVAKIKPSLVKDIKSP